MLKGLLPRRPVRRRMTVREAREVLKNQHAERLIDKEELKEEAEERKLIEEQAVRADLGLLRGLRQRVARRLHADRHLEHG